MTLGFYMDAEAAEDAFRLFQFYDADTEEKRIEVLKEMVLMGYKISIFQTKRDPEQVIQDHLKHGNILHIKSDETQELRSKDDGEERLQNKDYEFCPGCERPLWDCACNNDDASSS